MRLSWARLARPFALAFIPAAAVAVALSALGYGEVQQIVRSGADDPQIQMAEDAAVRLGAGTPAAEVVGSTTVDMAKSLAPFLIVFDDSGRPVAAGAQLHGATPTPPPGVFTSARSGEVRLTWQPEVGVRAAMVLVHYPGGFVLAARSLKEAERRENDELTLALVGMVAALALAALVAAATAFVTEIIPARHVRAPSRDH